MSPPVIRNNGAREDAEERFNKWVGGKLQGRREKLGMSRAAVCVECGIDETTLLRNESGETPLTCVRAAMLCHLYGMELRELFS